VFFWRWFFVRERNIRRVAFLVLWLCVFFVGQREAERRSGGAGTAELAGNGIGNLEGGKTAMGLLLGHRSFRRGGGRTHLSPGEGAVNEAGQMVQRELRREGRGKEGRSGDGHKECIKNQNAGNKKGAPVKSFLSRSPGLHG